MAAWLCCQLSGVVKGREIEILHVILPKPHLDLLLCTLKAVLCLFRDAVVFDSCDWVIIGMHAPMVRTRIVDLVYLLLVVLSH